MPASVPSDWVVYKRLLGHRWSLRHARVTAKGCLLMSKPDGAAKEQDKCYRLLNSYLRIVMTSKRIVVKVRDDHDQTVVFKLVSSDRKLLYECSKQLTAAATIGLNHDHKRRSQTSRSVSKAPQAAPEPEEIQVMSRATQTEATVCRAEVCPLGQLLHKDEQPECGQQAESVDSVPACVSMATPISSTPRLKQAMIRVRQHNMDKDMHNKHSTQSQSAPAPQLVASSASPVPVSHKHMSLAVSAAVHEQDQMQQAVAVQSSTEQMALQQPCVQQSSTRMAHTVTRKQQHRALLQSAPALLSCIDEEPSESEKAVQIWHPLNQQTQTQILCPPQTVDVAGDRQSLSNQPTTDQSSTPSTDSQKPEHPIHRIRHELAEAAMAFHIKTYDKEEEEQIAKDKDNTLAHKPLQVDTEDELPGQEAPQEHSPADAEHSPEQEPPLFVVHARTNNSWARTFWSQATDTTLNKEHTEHSNVQYIHW